MPGRGDRALEEKVRAAYAGAEARQESLDPRTPYRRAVQRALDAGSISADTAARLNARVEAASESFLEPVLAGDDRVRVQAARAYQFADDAARLERGELPAARKHVATDVRVDEFGRAQVVRREGSPTPREHAPGARGLYDKASAAYDLHARVAGERGRVAPPPPGKGSNLEQHVARAYQQAERAAGGREAAREGYRGGQRDAASEHADQLADDGQ